MIAQDYYLKILSGNLQKPITERHIILILTVSVRAYLLDYLKNKINSTECFVIKIIIIF